MKAPKKKLWIPVTTLSVSLPGLPWRPINLFRLLFRLGKVVNKKKVQSEGFEKYFNKGSGKFESNEVDLSEVVAKDENKAKDGVSNFCASWFHGS